MMDCVSLSIQMGIVVDLICVFILGVTLAFWFVLRFAGSCFGTYVVGVVIRVEDLVCYLTCCNGGLSWLVCVDYCFCCYLLIGLIGCVVYVVLGLAVACLG